MPEVSSTPEVFSRPDVNERYLSLGGIESQLGFLQGEILTLAEASIADKEQCKAFKDLAKQFFRGRVRWIGEISRRFEDESGPNPCVNRA